MLRTILICTLLAFSAVAVAIAQSPSTLVEADIALPGGTTAVYGPSGTLSYYRHADGFGSHRVLSNSSQQPYFDTAYAPYGEDYADASGSCPVCVGSPEFTFGFLPQDDSTQGGTTAPWGDLFLAPNRMYSAIQGRWLSPDPIISPSDPSGLNEYAYASNAPIATTDRTGLQDDNGDDCGDACLIFDTTDLNLDWGNGIWDDISWGTFTFGTPLNEQWWSNAWFNFKFGFATPMVGSVGETLNWFTHTPFGQPFPSYVIQRLSKGKGDYVPVCNGCSTRWGDVRLINTLGTAWMGGFLGPMAAEGSLDSDVIESVTPSASRNAAVINRNGNLVWNGRSLDPSMSRGLPITSADLAETAIKAAESGNMELCCALLNTVRKIRQVTFPGAEEVGADYSGNTLVPFLQGRDPQWMTDIRDLVNNKLILRDPEQEWEAQWLNSALKNPNGKNFFFDK